MEYVECATFHLNSGDISISILGSAVSNQFGTINGNRNDMTWSNVNFRTILGDMYDKYDKFNIKLVESHIVHRNQSVAKQHYYQFRQERFGKIYHHLDCYILRKWRLFQH